MGWTTVDKVGTDGLVFWDRGECQQRADRDGGDNGPIRADRDESRSRFADLHHSDGSRNEPTAATAALLFAMALGSGSTAEPVPNSRDGYDRFAAGGDRLTKYQLRPGAIDNGSTSSNRRSSIAGLNVSCIPPD